MTRSLRVVYTGMQGRTRVNHNWDAIDENTAVLVTAAEWNPSGGFQGLTEGRTHLGDADVFVTNIGVHGNEGGPGGTGGVEFHLHANHSSPLTVIATITAFDPAVEQTVVA